MRAMLTLLRRRTGRRLYVLSAATAVPLVVGAAVAIGEVPSATGQISGCYQKHSGKLRVIELQRGDTCRSSEVAIAWSERGPAGEPGPAGPPGPPGPANIRTIAQSRVVGNQSRVLLTVGPLTFTGVCTLDVPSVVGPLDRAELVVSSTSPLAAFAGDTNRTTIAITNSEAALPTFHAAPFALAALDGTSVSGVIYTGANNFGRSRECLFGGHVVTAN